MASIEWFGLDKLENSLTQAVSKSKTQVKQVIFNNTEEMKAEAMKLSPTVTWFLHDNIYTFHGSDYGEVISNAGYSGFVNFGTRFMMAQPFMTDSFNTQVKKMELMLKEVAEGLFE